MSVFKKLFKFLYYCIIISLVMNISLIFLPIFFGDFVSLIIAMVLIFVIFRKIVQKNKTKKISKKMDQQLRNHIEDYLSVCNTIRINSEIELTEMDNTEDVYKRLGVYYQDQYVCRLSEFEKEDEKTYNMILSVLRTLEIPEETQKEPKIEKDAAYFIEEINYYNVLIEHEEVSNQLYLTSSLLTSLSAAEQRENFKDQRVYKLYRYYLPLLLEILQNYCAMKDNVYLGTDIQEVESRLLKTIHLCNEALKTILSNVNEKDIMDMNVNMSTLEAILKKDGMIHDLEMNKTKEVTK